jgi:hypothetical protein
MTSVPRSPEPMFSVPPASTTRSRIPDSPNPALAASGSNPATNKAPTCRRCGDVIGVYEPVIMLANGGVRDSSRRDQRDGAETVGERYHQACYSKAQSEDPGEEPTRE